MFLGSGCLIPLKRKASHWNIHDAILTATIYFLIFILTRKSCNSNPQFDYECNLGITDFCSEKV
jgi:hypothetical protein